MRALLNAVEFPLRRSVCTLIQKVPGRHYQEPRQSKACRWSPVEAEVLAALQARYGWLTLHDVGTVARYRESLWRLWQLDIMRALAPEAFSVGRHWLEVGVKQWSVVEAMRRWLTYQQGSQQGWTLTGLELDPYRLLASGYTRQEEAQAYIRNTEGQACYRVGNVVNHLAPRGGYQGVFAFMPFVSLEPHRQWGIPDKLFTPDQYWRAIIDRCLAPGGWLMVSNQGGWEAEALEETLAPFVNALVPLGRGVVEPLFVPLNFPHVLSMWRKKH
jgi:hypothetical protein